MWLYHVEHAFVMLVGFLVGVALAMCIAPGDIVLVLMAGIVLGFFARGFLDQNLGGEFFLAVYQVGRQEARAKCDRGPQIICGEAVSTGLPSCEPWFEPAPPHRPLPSRLIRPAPLAITNSIAPMTDRFIAR